MGGGRRQWAEGPAAPKSLAPVARSLLLSECYFSRESVGDAGQMNPVAPVIPVFAIARTWLGATLRRAPLPASLSASSLPLGSASPAICPKAPPHVTIFTLSKTAPGHYVVLHSAGQGLAFTGWFSV